MLNKFIVPVAMIIMCSLLGSAYAATITYPNVGVITSNNATLTKYIQLKNTDELSLVFTTSAESFSPVNATISVSIDNASFAAVDIINLSNGTDANSEGVHYSSATNSSILSVNPAVFPYVLVQVPQITNESVTLRWSAGNEATIS